MQEKVTKFDLEAAFKALDEIDIPAVKGMRPNRMNLSEATKRVDRTSKLVEEYYDLNDQQDLEEASDEREAEVAQAKLARIEKIVDLNAKTPDELLPSYAGKAIIQCPQCMNVFFKEQSDIEGPEGEKVQIGDTVNEGEICQHCGNDSGYIFGGWVEAEAPAEAEEPNFEEPVEAENEIEELPAEDEIPETEEETAEDEVELEPVEELPAEEEPEEEEEKKEESFTNPTGELLNESANELDKKLAEHNEYIDVLQAEIEKEEEAIKSAKNDFIKKMHEDNLTALKNALDNAIPEEVKAEVTELPDANEVPEEAIEELPAEEEIKIADEENNEKEIKESLNESEGETLHCICNECGYECDITSGEFDGCCPNCHEHNGNFGPAEEPLIETCEDGLCEADEKLPELTDANIEKMLDSKEFSTEPTKSEIEAYLADGTAEDKKEEVLESLENIDEHSFNKQITEYLTKVYKNVNNFVMTECKINDRLLTVEGDINFKSGRKNNTLFEFYIPYTKNNKLILAGRNKEFSNEKAFTLNCKKENNNLITESLNYRYHINESLVKGSTKK